MNKLRLLILILGPIPIVAASFALSGWLKSDASSAFSSNDIVARGQMTGVAAAADITPQRRPSATRVLEKNCAEAAAKLDAQLGPSCRVIVRPPFLIAGDLSEAELERWHKRTIEPAARALANCYFKVPPNQPITVLLFSGEQSYNHYANKLFGEDGISIYGYYKPNLRTLVMNISTGGGTLVHELTHALIDFDFPKVPDWFNEGLASLHEQCRFREDASGPWIEGLENWRLPGLQEAIRHERLRSLASLIQGDDFRGRQEGMNYAQARYFCLYMQRQGVLRDYFRKFRANQKDDPRGIKTVGQVFPDRSWDELNRDFQSWVMTLNRDSSG